MKIPLIKLKANVWLYEGDAPWHFVTIDRDTSSFIKKEYPFPLNGFRSIPVNATINETIWKTSIFRTKDETFILPIKKEIRRKENIRAGDLIKFSLQLLI